MAPSAFEVTIFLFEFSRQRNAARLAQLQQPDLSLSSTISEILQFIPGTSVGLLAFLLFGTTAEFRKKYMEAFQQMRCCWARRRRSLDHGSGNRWSLLECSDPSDSHRPTLESVETESVELGYISAATKSRPHVSKYEDSGGYPPSGRRREPNRGVI